MDKSDIWAFFWWTGGQSLGKLMLWRDVHLVRQNLNYGWRDEFVELHKAGKGLSIFLGEHPVCSHDTSYLHPR